MNVPENDSNPLPLNDYYLTVDEFAEIIYSCVSQNQDSKAVAQRWHPEDLAVMFTFAVEYSTNTLTTLNEIRRRGND
jgi:hypothetical protein